MAMAMAEGSTDSLILSDLKAVQTVTHLLYFSMKKSTGIFNDFRMDFLIIYMGEKGSHY